MKTINIADRPTSSTSDILVAKFDGNKTKTLKKFYRKIAKRLSFPEHFGNNLDALYDCLSDLSWCEQPNVKLYIKNPSGFLANENEETRESVLEIFADASEDPIEEDRTFEVIGVELA